jgi:hypothetical protein
VLVALQPQPERELAAMVRLVLWFWSIDMATLEFARIDNNVVVERLSLPDNVDLEQTFSQEFIASLQACDATVQVGWRLNGTDFEPEEVTAPTPAQIRAAMPALSPRQFWLAASRINITKADVLALVDAMEDKAAAADMRIEITETVSFQRTNLAIDQLAALLSITPEQLDSLWTWAAQF